MHVCVWGEGCVGWSVRWCYSISILVLLLSSAAHLSIFNGTTLAAEPATIPQLSHKKYLKRGEKSRAPRKKKATSLRAKLSAGWRCRLLYVYRSACASEASVCIFKPWFAAFKMQNDQFQNIFIKHKTHIFFSACKDATKSILLKWNLSSKSF